MHQGLPSWILAQKIGAASPNSQDSKLISQDSRFSADPAQIIAPVLEVRTCVSHWVSLGLNEDNTFVCPEWHDSLSCRAGKNNSYLLTTGVVPSRMDYLSPSSIISMAVGSFPMDLHLMPLSPHLNAWCPQGHADMTCHHQHTDFSPAALLAAPDILLVCTFQAQVPRPDQHQGGRLCCWSKQIRPPAPDCLKQGKYADAALF